MTILATVLKFLCLAGVFCFTLLFASQVENNITVSWQVVFLPLYISCALYAAWAIHMRSRKPHIWVTGNIIVAIALFIQIAFIPIALNHHECDCVHYNATAFDNFICFDRFDYNLSVSYVGSDLEAIAGCHKEPVCDMIVDGSAYLFLLPAIIVEGCLLIFILIDGYNDYKDDKRMHAVWIEHAGNHVQDDSDEFPGHYSPERKSIHATDDENIDLDSSKEETPTAEPPVNRDEESHIYE